MSLTSFSQTGKTFIMIHAQWHGEWAWKKLSPFLESKGHKVITFDLPGYGADTTASENVTFNDCVQKIVSVVKAQQGSVILVAHSSAGIMMAQASEILGKDKLISLVFLDAFIPNNGESVFSLAEKYAPDGTPLAKTLILSQDQKLVSLNQDKVEDLLYHDCTATDIAYAKAHLRPSPIAALATPAQLGPNYKAIPKFYIHCTAARDMDKSELIGNVHCEKIFKMATSHTPFLSAPEELAEILDEIAKYGGK